MSLTEEQLKSLPDPINIIMKKLELDTIGAICNRLKKIGELSASDMHALNQLTDLGSNTNMIKDGIAKKCQLSEDYIYGLYYDAAQADYNFQKKTFEKLGKAWIPFSQNDEMIMLVESAARSTAQEFKNLSLTTGFRGYIKQNAPNQFVFLRTGEYTTLDTYYQTTVNYAIFQVRSGVVDYNFAMRKAIKELSDNGLISGVSYDNPSKKQYYRRLDSSVRNAFMGGQQRLSRHMAAILGEQFGADGMEISYHSGARPSHTDFAGGQFSMKDYEHICIPLLEDYNCYHRAFPIVFGVSTPTYTKKELEELHAEDKKPYYFEGTQYNKYSATQIQRKLETALRREKDRAVNFAAFGDKEQEQIALAKAAVLSAKYKEFSKAVNIAPSLNRTTVVNFTRSQASRLGWRIRKLPAM